MSLGNSLYNARKKSGLSQEHVAEKLGVSRQTISKWELDETLPDIRQSKRLSDLYHLTLDELIDFDIDLKEIEQIIENSNEEKQNEIDWSSAWSRKYPVLASYPSLDGIEKYSAQIENICEKVKVEFDFSELDSFLVVKDMVYRIYKKTEQKTKSKNLQEGTKFSMPAKRRSPVTNNPVGVLKIIRQSVILNLEAGLIYDAHSSD